MAGSVTPLVQISLIHVFVFKLYIYVYVLMPDHMSIVVMQVNMSSMVPSPKLKIIITPSACFTKLLKCNSMASNTVLSFGSSRLTTLLPSPSSFRRRSGFVSFAQGDVQVSQFIF